MAVLTAVFLGAQSATGVYLIENLPVYSRIFIKSQTRLGISPAKANLGFCDLIDMVSLQHDPDIILTFWESRNPDAREKLLDNVSNSTASILACTYAPGETIEAVCSTLN